jgi:hypothetical protein
MDFADNIRRLSMIVEKQVANIQTEEATKNALVMPFIAALGYNVFDPTEVTPELHADVGLKKGEKVDYAILRDGKPIILFECKWHGADLRKEHASQLYRYFSVTEARFGVLTNGIAYRFFTDLDDPNRMDSKPFFEFDLRDFRDGDLEELKKFSKASYDLQHILTTASELKYTKEILAILGEQLQEPTEDFVRLFTSRIYDGKLTQQTREKFTKIVQRAFRVFINDQINERLKSALGADAGVKSPEVPAEKPAVTDVKPIEVNVEAAPTVVTTQEEWEAFFTIRALLHSAVSSNRVFLRDVQTYCGVLLDDNNRKPICRLYLNQSRKAIGIFDGEGRKEERIPITSLDEIHAYADRLRAAATSYDGKAT